MVFWLMATTQAMTAEMLRLRLFPLSGFDWRSFAGKNCFVRTLEGREYRGTVLPDHAARHAFAEAVRNEAHYQERNRRVSR